MDTTFILDLLKNNNNYNEIFVAGATFTGIVLAIFFTLITLPIENILSKYSQEMIKRVQKDWIFFGPFLFLSLTFIYNLILISFNGPVELVLLSLGLSLCSVLVLILLVFHTFYMLDVRNQLNDISRKIKMQIRSRVKKSESKNKRFFENILKSLKLR